MEKEEILDELDVEDVGQKRYMMNQILERLVEEAFDQKDEELPEAEERIQKLEEVNGYMYKLSQEFLISSSTLEKERKLEKMVEHLS